MPFMSLNESFLSLEILEIAEKKNIQFETQTLPFKEFFSLSFCLKNFDDPRVRFFFESSIIFWFLMLLVVSGMKYFLPKHELFRAKERFSLLFFQRLRPILLFISLFQKPFETFL